MLRERFRTDLLPFQMVMAVTSGAIAGIIPLLGELREVLGFSEMAIGVVVAAGFLGSFVAQTAFSRLADLAMDDGWQLRGLRSVR